MKSLRRFTAAVLLTVALCAVSVSCDNKDIPDNTGEFGSSGGGSDVGERKSAVLGNSDDGEQWAQVADDAPVKLSNTWMGKLGTYQLEKGSAGIETLPDSGGQVMIGSEDTKPQHTLYFTDAATGEKIVLCDKLNCKHDNEACNAYFPVEDMRKLYNNSCVFGYDGKLYVLSDSKVLHIIQY